MFSLIFKHTGLDYIKYQINFKQIFIYIYICQKLVVQRAVNSNKTDLFARKQEIESH